MKVGPLRKPKPSTSVKDQMLRMTEIDRHVVPYS